MKKSNHIFIGIMVGIIGIVIVAAIVGPIRQSFIERNDTLVVRNISSVKNAIDDYYSENNMLPISLNDLDGREDADKLISSGLVTYKPEGTVMPNLTDKRSLSTGYAKYQLCVTYVSEDDQDGYSYSSRDEYDSYIDTQGHPKGEVCYKLKTYNY